MVRFYIATAAAALSMLNLTMSSDEPVGVILRSPVTQKSRPSLTAKELYKKYSGSILQVIASQPDGSAELGTGFFIGDKGNVATCLHVIQGASSVVVKATDGTLWSVQRVATDPKSDSAILELKAQTGTLPSPIPIGTTSKVETGDEVIVIGNPLGIAALQGSLSTGVVAGVRHEDGLNAFQITAPISPGNSGSPVLNRDGSVIAVVSYNYSKGQNLNFGMSIDHFKSLLDAAYYVPLTALPKPSTPPDLTAKSEAALAVQLSQEMARWQSRIVTMSMKWERVEVEAVPQSARLDSRDRLRTRQEAFEAELSTDGLKEFLRLRRLFPSPYDGELRDLDDWISSVRSLSQDRLAAELDLNRKALLNDIDGTKEAHGRYMSSGERLRAKIIELDDMNSKRPWYRDNEYAKAESPPVLASAFVSNTFNVFPDPDFPRSARVGYSISAHMLNFPENYRAVLEEGDVVTAITIQGKKSDVATWYDFCILEILHQGEAAICHVDRLGKPVDVPFTFK